MCFSAAIYSLVAITLHWKNVIAGRGETVFAYESVVVRREVSGFHIFT